MPMNKVLKAFCSFFKCQRWEKTMIFFVKHKCKYMFVSMMKSAGFVMSAKHFLYIYNLGNFENLRIYRVIL